MEVLKAYMYDFKSSTLELPSSDIYETGWMEVIKYCGLLTETYTNLSCYK
jgi:hypothetical protein